MKNNTIEIYRRRIAIAALNRMKRKTGSYRLTVSMPDDNIQFIDIDEEAMLQLLQRFENRREMNLQQRQKRLFAIHI